MNASAQTGLPRKVLAHAHTLGVHTDCLAAGVDGACSTCSGLIQLSLDHFYGHCDTPFEALMAIAADWHADVEVLQ